MTEPRDGLDTDDLEALQTQAAGRPRRARTRPERGGGKQRHRTGRESQGPTTRTSRVRGRKASPARADGRSPGGGASQPTVTPESSPRLRPTALAASRGQQLSKRAREAPDCPTEEPDTEGHHARCPSTHNQDGRAAPRLTQPSSLCQNSRPPAPLPWPVHPPSEVRPSVSVVLQLSAMSHRRTVLSQEALARTDFTGLKHRLLMGPSWPDRTCGDRRGGMKTPPAPRVLRTRSRCPEDAGRAGCIPAGREEPRPEAGAACSPRVCRGAPPACGCAPGPQPCDSYVQESARLHGPDEDLEGVLRPGRNDLPAAVHGNAGELGGPWRREGAEVPVPVPRHESSWQRSVPDTPAQVPGPSPNPRLYARDPCLAITARPRERLLERSPVEVKGTHGPIHGRGHDDIASGSEGHAGDPTRVLRKSDEAEATEGVPHLDLQRGEGGRHQLRTTHTHTCAHSTVCPPSPEMPSAPCLSAAST